MHRRLLGAFDTFANAVRGSMFWTGYNTEFDKKVLWYQLLRYGLERNFPWPPRDLRCHEDRQRQLGFVPGKRHNRWKLTDAYQKIFGKPFPDAHSGIADVRATAEIMREKWAKEYVTF
jgi:DNA polymerase-3 subunit alpha